MAFKHGNHTIADLNSNETEIRSPSNLVLYPTDNIWISQGTKLIFEGTVPDDYEAKLQANAVTADRDIILPDESGTLATQAYVTSAVSSGSISDTDALAEGSTNLYYTDARVDARIPTVISAFTNDSGYLTSVPAQTFASITGKPTTIAGYGITDAFDGAYSSLTGTPTMYANSDVDAHLNQSGPTSGYVLSWNGSDYAWVAQSAYTNFNTDFDTRLATKSTTDLAEGTNLYYTDARADTRISNALAGNVTVGGTLDVTGATTLDGVVEINSTGDHALRADGMIRVASTTDGEGFRITDRGGFIVAGSNARVFANNSLILGSTDTGTAITIDTDNDVTVANNLDVSGNLTVSGTTTTVNSNTVNIGDSIITLNSDETGSPSQNGGIEIERGTSTNVQLRFNETSDAWEFTNDGTTYVALGTASTFSGNSDGVTEGSTNLYYTDARSRSAISVGGDLSYNSSTGVISFTETAQDFAYASLTGAPTNVSTFTNDSGYITGYTVTSGDVTGALGFTPYNATNPDGYITGYTVTQGDVTAHQAALSITQSQISDLDHYTDADVDAHLSGGTGVNYASGVISIGQGVSTSSHVQFHCIGVGTPASTTQGEIRATADITAYYSSDANLKENVINITNALEKVQQIRGVEFDWKQEYIDARGGEDDYFIRKHDVGVIAQEVEAVLPEVVGTREDGTKAVKYDRITSLLIEAIKEQQSQIDQLKTIVEELKNK